MSGLINRASAFSAVIIAVTFLLAYTSAIVIMVEFFGRAFGVPGVLEFLQSPSAVYADRASIASNLLLHGSYAVFATLAAVLTPVALRNAIRTESTVGWGSRLYWASVIGASLTGLGMAFTQESSLLGSADRSFFFIGFSLIWIATYCMWMISRSRRDHDMALEWTIHSSGMACVWSVSYLLAAIIAMFGFYKEEMLVTGVILGFSTVIFSSFSIVLLLRSK